MDVILLIVAFGVWFFFFRCEHEWEYLETLSVYEEYGDTYPIYREKVYQCKNCLKIRKEKY